jgi:hypothetical protein
MGITPREKTATSKQFYCLYCEGDTTFDSYSKLHNHYKSTHDKVRYACQYCGIYLRQDDFIDDHIKLFHAEVHIFKAFIKLVKIVLLRKSTKDLRSHWKLMKMTCTDAKRATLIFHQSLS